MAKKHLFKLVEGKPFKLITFPCQASIHRKVVYNLKDFARIFNASTKFSSKGMYNSIYSFDTILPTGKPYFNSARVDKLWMDVDLDDYGYDLFKCWLGMLSTHMFLEFYNIMTVAIFSGNGYHFYPGADSSGVPDDKKNDYINTILDDLQRVTGTNYCIATVTAPTARIARTIGSYCVKKTSKENLANPKYHDYIENFIEKNGFTDRYCISLTDEDIHAGYMHIYQKSTVRSFDVHVMGKYKIAMTSLHGIRKHTNYVLDENKINEIKNIDDESINDVYDLLEKFSIYKEDVPPCINTLLKNREMGYQERYALSVYLSELDLSVKEIELIWRHVLSPRKFKHGMETNPPRNAVAKSNAGLYNVGCKTMQEMGYCDEEKCEKKTLFPFLKN